MKSAEWWAENWDNHELVKAEVRACFEANNAEPEPISSREVLQAIKRIHATGGRHLTPAEVVEFIGMPVQLGKPTSRRRGRPVTKDQYRLAYERRRGLYQSFVRLPKGVRRNTGQHLVSYIQSLFAQAKFDGVPVRHEVRYVAQHLTAKGIQPPDDSYLRKIRRRRIIEG